MREQSFTQFPTTEQERSMLRASVIAVSASDKLVDEYNIRISGGRILDELCPADCSPLLLELLQMYITWSNDLRRLTERAYHLIDGTAEYDEFYSAIDREVDQLCEKYRAEKSRESQLNSLSLD